MKDSSKRRVFIVAVGVSSVLAGAIAGGAPTAGAASPPVTGTITCALDAESTFKPPLGYAPGHGGHRIGAHAKSKWKLTGALTDCTGAQTGGRPGALPIDHADVKITGRATGHQCRELAADGLEVTLVRISWLDASGKKVGVTRGAGGTVAVENVGLLSGFPPTMPPGPPTFSGSSSAGSTSTAFPGESVMLAGLGDPILLALPCSTTSPPVDQGITGITFSGLTGPSTLSVG